MEPTYVFAAIITAMSVLASVVDFIPILNTVTDIVGAGFGAEPPAWQAFGLKYLSTVVALQYLMPYFERMTRATANTWDDNLFAKIKMVLAFSLELFAAVGAVDPQFGRRVKAITGARKMRK